jgi:hypothetical protein
MLDVIKLPAPQASYYTADQMLEYANQVSQAYKDEILNLKSKLADVEYDLYLFRMIANHGLDIRPNSNDFDHFNQYHNKLLALLEKTNETVRY